MSFRDRLLPCSYISPSGKSHQFLYDGVERSGSKRLAVHERPGQNGALFQDMGQSPLEYPLDIYIAGADYDLAADDLAAALSESGRGTLEHPRWGTLTVFPTTYTQTESFTDGERMAKFSIKFVEAPPESSVIGSPTTSAAILSSCDDAKKANFATWATKTAADAAKIKATVVKTVNKFNATLSAIAGIPADIASEINQNASWIERSIDALAQTPTTLCDGITALASIPAQIDATASSKLGAYSELTTDAIDRLIYATFGQSAISVVTLIAIDIATIEAAATGTLSSRDDAISIAESIVAQYEAIKAAIESATESGYYPSTDLLALLAALHSSLSSYLLEQSYSLRIERRMVLGSDRNPIELIMELYPDTDDIDAALDIFLADNHLTGDSILLIPRGTEIRYYAQS